LVSDILGARHSPSSSEAFATLYESAMHAVDTNVLVRLLARDDPKQTASAEAFVAHGGWVSHLVLVETLWVLDSVYGLAHSRLVRAVEMLLDHRALALQDPEVVTAALAAFRKGPKLGFSDCMVLEVARKAGHLPLGTFDRQLEKLRDTQRLK
jgi:predicted nucleic-acid-binding protein